MALSQLVSSDVEHTEFLDVSNHTFSSALSCGDWDLSDHSDLTEDLDHLHSDCKAVRFGKVRVRTYPMILGDNPSCSKGLPVTLDWTSIGASEEFDLNYMDSDDRPRRPVARLSSRIRQALLLRMGVSQGDASKISKEIDEIKRSRSLSSLDHRAENNVQPMHNDRQPSMERVEKPISMKEFNMDEYLQMVSFRRQKARVVSPAF